jgi:hypothetical protein
MRITVSPEQLKFFERQGYLELEHLISQSDSSELLISFEKLRDKSPGYTEENCFRSIPLIATLARKRGWGQIAADLMHKKPLRLAYDRFWSQPPEFHEELDRDSCGLLLKLNTGHGTFFRQFTSYPFEHIQKECYLFLILTSKNLPETHPLIVR